MKKNITYKESRVKTNDNLYAWKELIDTEKYKSIYLEYNNGKQIIFYI